MTRLQKLSAIALLAGGAFMSGSASLALFVLAIDADTPAGIEAVVAGLLYAVAACSSMFCAWQVLEVGQ